jgi:hypothetical protein
MGNGLRRQPAGRRPLADHPPRESILKQSCRRLRADHGEQTAEHLELFWDILAPA